MTSFGRETEGGVILTEMEKPRTHGWLQRVCEPVKLHAELGLVGPVRPLSG